MHHAVRLGVVSPCIMLYVLELYHHAYCCTSWSCITMHHAVRLGVVSPCIMLHVLELIVGLHLAVDRLKL